MPPEFNIERPKQVIVEGVDDVRVMEALCDHLHIDDIQMVPCGGYDALRQFLRTFSADPDFRRVRSLAVVVDADENPPGRRQGVADALASAGLPRPWISRSNRFRSPRLTVAYLVAARPSWHDDGGCLPESRSRKTTPQWSVSGSSWTVLTKHRYRGRIPDGCQRHVSMRFLHHGIGQIFAWARLRNGVYGDSNQRHSGH